MHELVELLQSAEHLVSLEPEELGSELLFALRARRGVGPNQSMFLFGNLLSELAGTPFDTGDVPQALAEAWAWLEVQGLLVPAPGQIGSTGWRVRSRRAKRFQNRSELRRFDIARRLPREMLHPKFQQTVWAAFMRGEFDVGVFQAMKAVEVAVREMSGLDKLVGVNLMRQAFHPETGPMTDMSADSGERFARSDLFAGAIGSFKNRYSHRDVALDDPQEAIEIVLLASHLMRIVDARALVVAMNALYRFPPKP